MNATPINPASSPKKDGATFYLRVSDNLKGRAVRASRKRNLKLTAWLHEAILEKCEKDGGMNHENS